MATAQYLYPDATIEQEVCTQVSVIIKIICLSCLTLKSYEIISKAQLLGLIFLDWLSPSNKSTKV